MVMHLLSIDDLTRADIEKLFQLSDGFLEVAARPIKKVPTLRGRTVINLFLEPSTRTQSSFELAAKRLSADVINIKGTTSSVVKGESLKDTILTLESYRPDIIVMRHPQVGASRLATRYTKAAIVNAGDGTGEHPTQCLLDLYTIQRTFGHTEGLKIGMVGDILRRWAWTYAWSRRPPWSPQGSRSGASPSTMIWRPWRKSTSSTSCACSSSGPRVGSLLFLPYVNTAADGGCLQPKSNPGSG